MAGRGLPEPFKTGRGEQRLGASRVGRALSPLYQVACHEAVDQTGDAALAQLQRIRQRAHPKPAAVGLRKKEQGPVLRQGQLVLSPEVVVEATPDPGVGDEERAPRPEPGIARMQESRRGRDMSHAERIVDTR